MRVQFMDNGEGEGEFYVEEGGEHIGEMSVLIEGDIMTVKHTEVHPDMEGKGLARLMLDGMVEFARENSLKVLPKCSYVKTQFQRHDGEYGDVWQRQ